VPTISSRAAVRGSGECSVPGGWGDVRIKAVVVTLAMVLAGVLLAPGAASAQSGSRLSLGDLRRALLSDAAISRASGTGLPTVSTAITCSTSVPFGASYCYREYLHSDEAKAAHAPWPTHVNVFSFSSAEKARKYVAVMAKRFSGPKRLSATATRVVGFDPSAVINDGLQLPTGQEASVVEAQGSRVVWTACGDLSGTAQRSALVSCAQSVAKAQAAKLF